MLDRSVMDREVARILEAPGFVYTVRGLGGGVCMAVGDVKPQVDPMLPVVAEALCNAVSGLAVAEGFRRVHSTYTTVYEGDREVGVLVVAAIPASMALMILEAVHEAEDGEDMEASLVSWRPPGAQPCNDECN